MGIESMERGVWKVGRALTTNALALPITPTYLTPVSTHNLCTMTASIFMFVLGRFQKVTGQIHVIAIQKIVASRAFSKSSGPPITV